jgi:3-(3-hydroxy-phenyl)propionate hydroxylase
LAAVLRGHADEALLESYNDERLEAAQENVKVTRRTARFLRPADGIERAFRKATISLAKHHAFARPLINTGRMAEANRYAVSDICKPEGGWMLQNVGVQWAKGRPGSLSDLLQWADGRLLLLVFGALKRTQIQKLALLSMGTPVRIVQVVHKTRGDALEHIVDKGKQLRKACGAEGHGWALLRPDAYLAARGQHIDGKLIQAIAQALALH